MQRKAALTLALVTFFLPTTTFARGGPSTPFITESAKLRPSDGSMGEVFGESASVSGDTLIVGARLDNAGAGAAYIFQRVAGHSAAWEEVTKLQEPAPAPNRWFGGVVAVDGDLAAVGMVPPFGAASEVHVFERNAGGLNNWGRVATLSEDLGGAVAIDGDRIVISETDAFEALVFEKDQGGPGNWGLAATLAPAAPMPNEEFGSAVDLSGDLLVVGSPSVAGGPGAAYVFERDSGTGLWSEAAVLSPSGMSDRRFFGTSVALAGDTVAVGSPLEQEQSDSPNSGVAYLFKRDLGGPGAWGIEARLVPSFVEENWNFGSSIDLVGGTLVVGARLEESETGSAFWFSAGSQGWQQIAKVLSSDRTLGDNFASGVGVDRGIAVVGSKFDDDAGNNSGSAYVFELALFSDDFESGDTSAWTTVVP